MMESENHAQTITVSTMTLTVNDTVTCFP